MANQVACFIDNEGVQILQGELYSIGGVFSKNSDHQFNIYEIEANKPGMLYMFTDGFFDQMGGPENRKLMFPRLKEKFSQIWQMPVQEQKQELKDFYADWKGNNKQTDDVLIIGIQITSQ
jgi:serine phosphatase RsbU (regulator of sigma subunit)